MEGNTLLNIKLFGYKELATLEFNDTNNYRFKSLSFWGEYISRVSLLAIPLQFPAI